MKIIPAIDLKDGKCVRLLKGDFDMTTEYSSNPEEIGARFSELDVEAPVSYTLLPLPTIYHLLSLVVAV